MKSKKCDICGKEFDYGFLADIKLQGGHELMNVAEDRFEIGEKDICRDCYCKLKKLLTCCCIPPES